MTRQLSFDLPARVVLGREDFFVSPANALAVAMIDDCDAWPNRKLVLSGPAGAGKTHLAHVWSAARDARLMRARDLTAGIVPDLARGPVGIEDVPAIATNAPAQAALFHLFNLTQAEAKPMLLTGRGAPSHWGLTLPDLHSRVSAACHVALEPPDDALLAAVLAKLFADRQIVPKPNLIPYLVAHMERSFDTAARLVDALDRAALDTGLGLSRTLAARLLGDGKTTG